MFKHSEHMLSWNALEGIQEFVNAYAVFKILK
jgi:hypothetical protein